MNKKPIGLKDPLNGNLNISPRESGFGLSMFNDDEEVSINLTDDQAFAAGLNLLGISRDMWSKILEYAKSSSHAEYWASVAAGKEWLVAELLKEKEVIEKLSQVESGVAGFQE